MITIIYSTHKSEDYNKNFKEHIIKSVGIKDVQILEYVNHNEYSLSQVYNRGISESIYDIVVCCHNDIKLENGWGKKLLKDFEDNLEYGIIGKAGSCYFSESGVYWDKMIQTMVGQVYHHPEGQNKWLNRYSPKLPYLIPVVTIDGLFISFNKTKIKHAFDETIGKFHFYDHGFCVPNYLDGVKIGVTSSFEITHQSVGQPNQEFFESKTKFLDKYKNVLPLNLLPENVFFEKISPIKKVKKGKVAVIIPTKGKVEMLIECVQSFINNCDSKLYDIFIADTGSNDLEKKEILEYISNFTNIKLIEYDYYHFSKINNDVVKNHISEKYEFLLFCNNDIKLLNDAITGMLKTFYDKNNVGTLGARLHFKDNTIQHSGIIAGIDSNNSFQITHIGIMTYYQIDNKLTEVIGSTAALLMIRKSVFNKCNGFNEKYISCFEDVELNLECIKLGLINYVDSRIVAYHYESQTRNDDSQKTSKLVSDYNETLLPFVKDNFEKIKKYLIRF